MLYITNKFFKMLISKLVKHEGIHIFIDLLNTETLKLWRLLVIYMT